MGGIRSLDLVRNEISAGVLRPVVNEAYPDPSIDLNGDGAIDQLDEFIEIFNPSDLPIDIGGWILRDNSASFEIQGVSLLPGEFSVFWRNETDLKLGRDDLLELVDPNGSMVDVFQWEDLGKGFSFQRTPDGSEMARRVQPPSPGSPNLGEPGLLINEVMVDPEGSNLGFQWVELLNTGGSEWIEGLLLTNGEGVECVMPSCSLGSGERALVIFGDSENLPPFPRGTRIIQGPGTRTVYVSGDDLAIITPEGFVLDYVGWGNSSHIRPPMDELGRSIWGGPVWDVENGTMIPGAGENPIPRTGYSLMRKCDGMDSDLPGDWGDVIHQYPYTSGWNNEVDPSLHIKFEREEIEFNMSERKDIRLLLENAGNIRGDVSVNVSNMPSEWTVAGAPMVIRDLAPGENRTIDISIKAPGEMNLNRTAEIQIHAFHVSMDFLVQTKTVRTLVPAVDLGLDDVSIRWDGGQADIVPSGAFIDISGSLVSLGELDPVSAELLISVRDLGSPEEEEVHRDLLSFNSLVSTSRRSFEERVDTLGCSGPLAVEVLCDPNDLLLEANEENNIFSSSIELVEYPPLPGQMDLLIDRVLWNCSAEETFISIRNPREDPVDISGMLVSDGQLFAAFPEGKMIGPGGKVVVVWGSEGYDRCPDGDSTFWMIGGPSGSRMKLANGAPDPFGTGYISLLSRYRIPVDKVELKRSVQIKGTGIEKTHVEASWGTVITRKTDPDSDGPLDTDSPSDWEAPAPGCILDSFLMDPGLSSCGEFVQIRAKTNKTDLSGTVLYCGGRASVLPNGTFPDKDGYLTISMDPDAFQKITGILPEYSTGTNGGIDQEGPVPTEIPRYPNLILPNSGGELLLIDPGNRVVDRVSWGPGEHSDIGMPGDDIIMGRIYDGAISEMGWMAAGTGRDIIYGACENSRPIMGDVIEFDSLHDALSWMTGEETLTVVTNALDEPAIISLLLENLENGIHVELFLLGEPWKELPGALEDAHPTSSRAGVVKYLHDRGAAIGYLEGAPSGYGSSMLVSGDRLLWFPRPLLSYPCEPWWNMDWIVGMSTSDELLRNELVRYYGSTSNDGKDIIEVIPDVKDLLFEGALPDIKIVETKFHRANLRVGEWNEREVRDQKGELRILACSGPLDAAHILSIARRGDPVRIIISPDILKVHGNGNEGQPSNVLEMLDINRHPIDMASLLEEKLASLGQLLAVSSIEDLDVEVRTGGVDQGLIGSSGMTLNDNVFHLPLPSPGSRSLPPALVGEQEGPGLFSNKWETAWREASPFPWYLFPDEGISDPPRVSQELLLEEVYYDTYLVDDPDEYIALKNHGNSYVNLRGYLLTDSAGDASSSDGILMFGDVVIEPGDMIFIARDGGSFADQNGFEADIGWWGKNCSPKALCLSGDLRLSNNGDGVYLRDPYGRIVDCVIWGAAVDRPNIWSSFASGNWNGDPVGDIGWGHVLYRTGGAAENSTKDTNSAYDWTTVRPRYPGQSRLGFFPMRDLEETTFGICPYSGSEVLERAISEASEEILVNVYEFTSSWIASSLIGARSRGIRVRLLLEGNPVGGISLMEKSVISRMLSAGIEVRLMSTDTSIGMRDRYRYDHAKYMIIDGASIVVSTDNFKDTSFPPPGSIVSSGTRGWVCSVSSGDIAMDLERVFNGDFNGPDITVPEVDVQVLDIDRYDETIPNTDPVPAWGRVHEIAEGGTGRIVVAPDHLAPEGGPLLELIGSARKEILLELMDIDAEYLLATMPNWTGSRGGPIITSKTSIEYLNPFVKELLDASGRGVKVRMLLDGTDFNGDGSPDNLWTIGVLTEIVQQMGYGDNFKIMVHPSPRFLIGGEISMIHNKGMVIDGEKVWISSFNWGPTSGLENREVGMIISSKEIASQCRECILFDMGGTLQDLFTISGMWAKGEFQTKGACLMETGFKFEWKGEENCRVELVWRYDGADAPEEIILGARELSPATTGNIRMQFCIEREIEDAVMILRISTGELQYDVTIITALRPPDVSGLDGPSFFGSPWVPIAMISMIALGASVLMSVVRKGREMTSEE
ncbi:MAG: lamin tail domain-containing protein [Thermoplasmatota archaeon]